ncbi:uncharacterized protein BO88DRAFT_38066 [Aspergillus vadensis CBS 113365]|uniref:Uncharacterized protein n=1 Tax=Aspergillus vadensis (strain CBS 113365 / IMI 142717 / IBT 24658) TaxID=1448311 RepID=A0A319BAN2_ASPVC|nr:hypothetical protein BO88DRAFT_38066 [Aspergillus vadensis CBS 113365]PYH69655.1 hypothetical protein BO88DRAFT_38066 [Aspergillus vadensis CBS 113365]
MISPANLVGEVAQTDNIRIPRRCRLRIPPCLVPWARSPDFSFRPLMLHLRDLIEIITLIIVSDIFGLLLGLSTRTFIAQAYPFVEGQAHSPVLLMGLAKHSTE